MNTIYTGIGSRSITRNQIATNALLTIAQVLATKNYTLRSGGADGCDSLFEQIHINNLAPMEIYIPWKRFNNNTSSLYTTPTQYMDEAASIHPAWERCSPGAKKLHARNVAQIKGYNGIHSKFVICYTPNGKTIGGTATAIRLALKNNIPVFNIGTFVPDVNPTQQHFELCMQEFIHFFTNVVK